MTHSLRRAADVSRKGSADGSRSQDDGRQELATSSIRDRLTERSPTSRQSDQGQIARLVVWMLRGYQLALSPIFTALGSRCCFEPSCSQYMIDAVRTRGVLVGGGLGLWRLVRCNPFSRGGYDPAPAKQGAVRDVSRETI